MHLDDALSSIGGLGRQQFLICLILCLARISIGLSFLSYTFLRNEVPVECEKDKNVTDVCDADNCGGVKFDTAEGDSLASEWSLICKE